MEILTRVNWVDLIVVIIVLRICYVALGNGLSLEILPFIGAIIMVVLSLNYYVPLASFIIRNTIEMKAEIINFLSFIILIMCVGVMLKVVGGFVDKMIKVTWNPLIEKLGGFIVGASRAAVVASITLIMIALIPAPYFQRSIRDKSLTGAYVLNIGASIYETAVKILPVIRIDKTPFKKEDLMKGLISDKVVMPEVKKEKEVPFWE